jgi:hypothetical protein
MSAIAYTVIATFSDPRVAQEWIDWLVSGHIDSVLQHGATDAEIVRLDSPDVKVEVRYHFPSRSVFSDYELNHAPALRAEGIAKFPPQRGVSYQRTIGVVQSIHPVAPRSSPEKSVIKGL